MTNKTMYNFFIRFLTTLAGIFNITPVLFYHSFPTLASSFMNLLKKRQFFVLLFSISPLFSGAVHAQEVDFSDSNPGLIIHMLTDKQVLGDLEMTAQQVTALEAAHSELKTDLKSEMAKPAGTRNVVGQYAKSLQKMLDEVLLSHQRERLMQLLNRRELLLRFHGSYPGIIAKAFATKIRLKENQKEKLQAIQKNFDEEVQKEIGNFHSRVESLLKKQREDSLATLSGNQKEMVENALGEKAWGIPAESVTKQILEFHVRQLEAQSKKQ